MIEIEIGWRLMATLIVGGLIWLGHTKDNAKASDSAPHDCSMN